MRRMGEMAMENLLKLMSAEESVAQVRVVAELIVRRSTGRVRSIPGPQMQGTRGTHGLGAGRGNG